MDSRNDMQLSHIWQMLEEKMREDYQGTELSYNLWFGRMELRYLDADSAVFVCENETKQNIISKKYVDFISDCLAAVIGYMPDVEIKVDTSLAPIVPDDGTIISPLKIIKERQKAREEKQKYSSYEEDDEPLNFGDYDDFDDEDYDDDSFEIEEEEKKPVETKVNPPMESGERRLTYNDDYTFENFIVGNSNRFAHAAALNVADNVGMKINPLFIWGPSGLGKTHLMYAIANRALQRKPDMKVIYVKGEEFMNQMIEAIQRDDNRNFRQKYRNADMLLLDDIQFIAGKEGTQLEFFHTFEALYEDKKQIIITSDRPPKELTSLEERIRSRFEAGLLADIQPPDYELRLAILRNKSGQSKIDVPIDVIDFLAKNLQENIRQLEGVVKKLAMTHLLTGLPVNMDMVINTVPEYLRDTEPISDTVERIIACVARHNSVTVDDIMGTVRKKNIKNARNIAMYVVRSITGMSLPKIGTIFNRDHTTVHSNINMIEEEIVRDPVLEASINEIIKEIKRGN